MVLAYSGGLDTSVCIKWLQERYDADVISVTLDLGQKDNFDEIKERALALGVKNHYQIEAKDEFIQDYIIPAIKANALYEEKYPLSTALGRPLIAKKLVQIAEKEGADAVAHGCTGKGNDQVRLDVTIKCLNPSLKVIAPVREWNMNREEEMVYAQEKGIPIRPSRSIYSIDQNIWGRSIEGGPLEDPNEEPDEDIFEWVTLPEEAPDTPGYLDLEFHNGIPIKANGVEMGPRELIEYVNAFAGSHGIGIIDHIEDRLVGIKSREVYECPAAVSIIEAHKDLEKLVLTKHELSFKSVVDEKWAWLVYCGLWLEPLKEALDAFVNETQNKVSGNVRLKLYKGNMRVVGRSSKYSIYDLSMATYTGASRFDQSHSTGFIELWGLQSRLASLVRVINKRRIDEYLHEEVKQAE